MTEEGQNNNSEAGFESKESTDKEDMHVYDDYDLKVDGDDAYSDIDLHLNGEEKNE